MPNVGSVYGAVFPLAVSYPENPQAGYTRRRMRGWNARQWRDEERVENKLVEEDQGQRGKQ